MHIESYDGLLSGRRSYSNLIAEFSLVLADYGLDIYFCVSLTTNRMTRNRIVSYAYHGRITLS
jgi:hypothetical protein